MGKKPKRVQKEETITSENTQETTVSNDGSNEITTLSVTQETNPNVVPPKEVKTAPDEPAPDAVQELAHLIREDKDAVFFLKMGDSIMGSTLK